MFSSIHQISTTRLSNFSAKSFINIYKGFAETIDLPLPTNCKKPSLPLRVFCYRQNLLDNTRRILEYPAHFFGSTPKSPQNPTGSHFVMTQFSFVISEEVWRYHPPNPLGSVLFATTILAFCFLLTWLFHPAKPTEVLLFRESF